jgi:hypothetical protein
VAFEPKIYLLNVVFINVYSFHTSPRRGYAEMGLDVYAGEQGNHEGVLSYAQTNARMAKNSQLSDPVRVTGLVLYSHR